jgi:mannose-6-phosphate isomerase-like protein (cupin superfamily)
MRSRIILLLVPVLIAASAGAIESAKTNEVDLWSAAYLHSLEGQLHDKIAGPRSNITLTLADFGASGTAIGHREANGPGESHAGNDDYFIAQSGAATLLTGGTIVNAKTTAPGEVRGDGIEGGQRRELSPGDIVHIAAQVPHQLLVEPGKRFTYFIIRTPASTPR